MTYVAPARSAKMFVLVAGLVALAGCAGQTAMPETLGGYVGVSMTPEPLRVTPPSPDPRVGLRAGLFDAAEAMWNLRVVSSTPPTERFVGVTNSDLAFTGEYAIQGNYSGVQIWNIS